MPDVICSVLGFLLLSKMKPAFMFYRLFGLTSAFKQMKIMVIAATLPGTINFSKGHVFSHCFRGGGEAQCKCSNMDMEWQAQGPTWWAHPVQKDTDPAVGFASHLQVSSGCFV